MHAVYCFKALSHDERLQATLRANVAINVTAICNDACNVAEVGSISTFGTLQETLHATPAKPVTRSNSVVACNVACNVSSCNSAFSKAACHSSTCDVHLYNGVS